MHRERRSCFYTFKHECKHACAHSNSCMRAFMHARVCGAVGERTQSRSPYSAMRVVAAFMRCVSFLRLVRARAAARSPRAPAGGCDAPWRRMTPLELGALSPAVRFFCRLQRRGLAACSPQRLKHGTQQQRPAHKSISDFPRKAVRPLVAGRSSNRRRRARYVNLT